MAIVPQDPVLFCETIRYNLDPLEQYSDAELWEALKISQMDKVVEALPEKLHYQVSEGYTPFWFLHFLVARIFLLDKDSYFVLRERF